MIYYRAINTQGDVITGAYPLKNASERDVILYLQGQGVTPLSIQATPFTSPGKPTRPKSRNQAIGLIKSDISWFKSQLESRDLVFFARNVAFLLDAGISLPRALVILQELHRGRMRFQRVLKRVHDDLREGSTFWEALDKQQPHVPPIFVSMVRAGETGGALPVILTRLAAYLEEMQELRDYVRGAMIYPAILTVTSLVSLVMMLTLVVPKFAEVFQDMGMELPGMTQVMFRAGETFQNHWLVMLFGLMGVAGSVWMALKTPRGKQLWDRLVLHIPAIGAFRRKIEVARFCRTLGTLLDSGVPILQSMQIVRGVVLNAVLNQAIGRAHDDLKRGEVLSAALDKTGLFPLLTINMIGVGEETGQLGGMLDKVGQLYDKELKKGIKTFSSFFEPVGLLVMGTLIGGMVISMLMAIFSINDMQM